MTPTKELQTLISSRMKNLKSKGKISEAHNPSPPYFLVEENQLEEEEDRVKYIYFPTC